MVDSLSTVPGSFSEVQSTMAGLGSIEQRVGPHACRIPQSTTHAAIPKWCGPKPRLLLLNRVDQVSDRDRAAWAGHFARQGTPAIWTDGVSGLGSGQVC